MIDEDKPNYVKYIITDLKIKDAILDSIAKIDLTYLDSIDEASATVESVKEVIIELEGINLREVILKKIKDSKVNDTNN